METDERQESPQRVRKPKTLNKKASKPTSKSEKVGRKSLKVQDTADLFQCICHGTGEILHTADDWLSQYDQERDYATLELLSTIAKACGCEQFCPKEALEDTEPADALTDLVTSQRSVMEKCDFALQSRDKEKWGAFKKRFPKLWEKIIARSKRGPLFDDYFIGTLIPWLTAMSTSNLRGFRQTAAVAVFNVISGLCHVCKELEKTVKSTNKRLKGKAKVDSEETKQLESVHDNLQQIFQHTWVLRYRDKSEDIRKMSLEYMTIWIKILPSFFVTEKRTRYLGWALSDVDADVREKALIALKEAYNHDTKTVMGGFTERFIHRVLEMAKDVKASVAVEAVRVLLVIFKQNPVDTKYFTNDYIEMTLGKIFDPLASVRHEAAEFFKVFLRSQVRAESGTQNASEKAKTAVHKQRLGVVLEFMNCYDCDEVGSYVVDSLWDVGASFLYDWDMIVKALLNPDPDEDEEDEAEDHESLKARHMLGLVHAIMLKLNDKLNLPADKEEGRKTHIHDKSKKLTKAMKAEAITSLSTYLVPSLRDIITQYQSRPVQVIWIAEMIRNMDLTVFANKEFDDEYSEILDELIKLYHNFDNEMVLKELATTWEILSTATHPNNKKTTKRVTDLGKVLEKELRQVTNKAKAVDVDVDDATMKKMTEKYKLVWMKVAYYMWSMDATSIFWQHTLNAITQAPHGVIVAHLPFVIQTFTCGLMWKIKDQTRAVEEEENASLSISQMHLGEDMDSVKSEIHQLLTHEHMNDDVLCHLLANLSDTLVIFHTAELESLRKPVDDEMLRELVFAMQRVLTAPPAQNVAKELRLQRGQHREKMVVGVTRLVPYDSKYAGTILKYYASQGPAIANIIKHQRAMNWRVKAGSDQWGSEWTAVRLSFEDYLNAEDKTTETQTSNDVDDLIKKFVKEHNPHFGPYKKISSGTVPRILRSAIAWCFRDITQRSALFPKLTPYTSARALLKDEARSILKELNKAQDSHKKKQMNKDLEDDDDEMNVEDELEIPTVKNAIIQFSVPLQKTAGLTSDAELDDNQEMPTLKRKRDMTPVDDEISDDEEAQLSGSKKPRTRSKSPRSPAAQSSKRTPKKSPGSSKKGSPSPGKSSTSLHLQLEESPAKSTPSKASWRGR